MRRASASLRRVHKIAARIDAAASSRGFERQAYEVFRQQDLALLPGDENAAVMMLRLIRRAIAWGCPWANATWAEFLHSYDHPAEGYFNWLGLPRDPNDPFPRWEPELNAFMERVCAAIPPSPFD